MDVCDASEGHLIIFDKRKKSWKEKMYTKKARIDGKVITVWGL